MLSKNIKINKIIEPGITKIKFIRNKITTAELTHAEENKYMVFIVIDDNNLTYELMKGKMTYNQMFGLWESNYLCKPLAINPRRLTEKEKVHVFKQIKKHVISTMRPLKIGNIVIEKFEELIT